MKNSEDAYKAMAEKVRKYINEAPTTAERQVRKMEAHGFMYGSGNQKIRDLLKPPTSK
jgi:uncharacterized protein (DUF342 family)